METLRDILQESFNRDMISAVISNPREKGGTTKIKIRPVLRKEMLVFQCEEYRNNQAFHINLDEREKTAWYLKRQSMWRTGCWNSNRCSWRREIADIRFW